MDHHTVLYRLFDRRGGLMYVGITCGPGRRFTQHHRSQVWWEWVVGCTFEHYDTREEAMAAELAAIANEEPAFNVAGRPERQSEILRCAWFARTWVEHLPTHGVDRITGTSNLLDAFDLYDAYDSSPEVAAALNKIVDVLQVVCPAKEDVWAG